MSDLAKGGPVHSQAEGVVKVLHSDLTAIHLVTLLEALPIQETLEAIEELRGTGAADRQRDRQPQHPGLPVTPTTSPRPRRATSTPTPCARTCTKAGITLSDSDFAGLLTETIQHATRIEARAESAEQLDELDVPRLELPRCPTASTSAASTNSPKRSPTRASR